jgi:hypothetical protein
MITYFLILILSYIIGAFLLPLQALPDVNLSNDLTNALNQAGQYLGFLNFILPSSFYTVFAFVLGFEIAIVLFKVINWLIRKIPTIN